MEKEVLWLKHHLGFLGLREVGTLMEIENSWIPKGKARFKDMCTFLG
jgi:hypothetical protein